MRDSTQVWKAVTVIVPLEKKEVQVVIVLCEKVAQNAVGVATFDLVGREAKVDALYKVPQLSNRVPVKPPEKKRSNGDTDQLCTCCCPQFKHLFVLKLGQIYAVSFKEKKG